MLGRPLVEGVIDTPDNWRVPRAGQVLTAVRRKNRAAFRPPQRARGPWETT
jgi:hypothetical protein